MLNRLVPHLPPPRHNRRRPRLLEHFAPNLEPGDVITFADGQEAVVTARVEAEPGSKSASCDARGRRVKASETNHHVTRRVRPVRWTLAIGLSFVVVALPAQAARQASSATMTIRLISTTASTKLLVDRAPKGTQSRGDVVRTKSVLRNAVAQLGRPRARSSEPMWRRSPSSRSPNSR
jgi:hypothetical protein